MEKQNENDHPLNPETFAALGHVTRCAIIEFLAIQPARPTQIAKCVENAFGLWHHLGRLEAAGLIVSRRVEHKHSVYCVTPEALASMANQLASLANQAREAAQRPATDDATIKEELSETFAIVAKE